VSRHHLVLTLACAIAACGGEQRAPASQSAQPPEQPSTTPAADVSHGEAAIGSADTAPVDPHAPPRTTAALRRIRIEIRHATVTIAAGVVYQAWTFEGAVGVLRARE
jgi:hypothetical protein